MDSDKKLSPVNVSIRNYQSIESLDLEIRGFTCITGKTNIGKSAIVRAISSAILNNPVVGMVRVGAPYASVQMSGEGWAFKWEKGERGVNRYEISGKTYDKVGQNQLPEIENMGFRSVKVGKDEVHPWLASQFFPIFLLDKSGPQITDFISEVSRLNVLQDAVILSARGKRASTDEASSKATEASEFRKKQAAVSGINLLSSVCEDLDAQYTSIENYEQKISNASTFWSHIRSHKSRIDGLSSIESISVPGVFDKERVESVVKASQILHSLEESAKRVIEIRKIASVTIPLPPTEATKFQEIMKFAWIHDGSIAIKKLEGIGSVSVPEAPSEVANYSLASKLEASITSAKAALALFDDVKIPESVDVNSELQKISTYEKYHIILQSEATYVKNLNSELAKFKSELSDVEKELSGIPTCPTCQRPRQTHEH